MWAQLLGRIGASVLEELAKRLIKNSSPEECSQLVDLKLGQVANGELKNRLKARDAFRKAKDKL